MSQEREQFENNEQQEQQQQSPDAIASDLASSMSSTGSEEEFVAAEEKPTVNRNSLVLFGIILLGLGGYYFMYVRTGPKTAAAAAASAEAASAEQTIRSFLANGDQNVKSMQQTIKNTEQIVQQFKNDPSARQIPLSDLATNPFQFVPLRASNPTDDSGHQFQLDKEAAIRIIESLQLQSTVVNGNRNACMINNTLYAEGQQVEGMTIEKITSSTVIFRSGTHRFQKSMSK